MKRYRQTPEGLRPDPDGPLCLYADVEAMRLLIPELTRDITDIRIRLKQTELKLKFPNQQHSI